LLVDFAVDSAAGPLAGIYASMPHRGKVYSQERLITQSVDTLTDQNYRGKGVFKRLANTLFDRSKQQDVDFIYGFPNAHSAPGFFERLGWQRLGPVPFVIRPLNISYFVSQKIDVKIPKIGLPIWPSMGRVRRATLEEIDIDAIWTQFKTGFNVGVIRDREFLTWRLKKPDENYEILGIFDAQNRNTGFVIFKIAEKHEGRIGYIMELMTTPDDDASAFLLLAAAIQQLQSLNADAVLAWNLEHSPFYRVFIANGFLPFPEKFRPIELNFGMKSLAGDYSIARQDWYLSYLDSDTV